MRINTNLFSIRLTSEKAESYICKCVDCCERNSRWPILHAMVIAAARSRVEKEEKRRKRSREQVEPWREGRRKRGGEMREQTPRARRLINKSRSRGSSPHLARAQHPGFSCHNNFFRASTARFHLKTRMLPARVSAYERIATITLSCLLN